VTDGTQASATAGATTGATTGAAALLREIGLRPDGPVLWNRPLTTRAPGLYLVELAAPLPRPPIELTRVGKWIERVPGLRLDGARPTSKALVARLVSLWLPGSLVLYAGATGGSLGGRVLALAHHVLGDRRPHADGHWLHLLNGVERTRIWFAETDAPEEYLDALLDAFAASVGPALPPGRPAGTLVLPWANMRRPTGERQVHGITGSMLPEEAVPAPPPTRHVDVPPGDAEGARVEERGSGTVRRAQAATPGPAPARAPVGGRESGPPADRSAAIAKAREQPRVRAPRATTPKVVAPSARAVPVPLTADALARLEAELDELTRVKRPDVVARIKAARELGDLRENAEYQAAREEQSFLEGRVRLLEERKRNAVLIDESGGDRARIGSTVVVEHDGEMIVYALVGSTESDPAAGRISVDSPVGAALVRAVAGDEVEVRTPRGAVRYRVVEVR
jgi:transcription elongation factor GreA